jgi:hypothetical protein
LLIEIDGSDAGSGAYGLSVEASNTLIKGLIIIDFDDDGIESTESAKGLKVKGNLLGTDNLGSLSLGNMDGVDLDGSNNTVGGTVSSATNIILGNGSDGVRVAQGTGNRFLRNAIDSNGQLGIDLVGGTEDPPPVIGITLNDSKDPDTGPNGLQNYPWLNEANFSLPHTTTITGTLNSRPEKKFTIQFFSSEMGDPEGFGEGETFLGQKQVETNKKGNASFTFTTTLPELNDAISATATGGGGTSEFAHWIDVSL